MAYYPFQASRSVFRGMAQDYILGGVLRGQRTTDIINSLRELGLSYHTQDMVHDIQWWRSSIESWNKMRYTNLSKILSERFYLPSRSVRQGIYQTVMDVSLTNRETGETVNRRITIVHQSVVNGEVVYDTQQRYTRAMLNDQINDILKQYIYKGFELTKSIPVEAYYNPDKL